MPALDGLRGVAILLVILTHVAAGWSGALSIYQDTDGWDKTFAIPDWLETIASSGGLGVQLFFVVSAFTLTLRSEQNRADRLGGYAIRRIGRVGPGYWLAGIGYTVLAGLAPRLWAPQGVAPSDLAIAAVFGSAWQGRASMAVVPGGWSVACEVAFYVALPMLLRIINGRILRALLLTGVSVVFASLEYSARVPIVGAFPAFVHPIGQAPVFLCGITAAIITTRKRIPLIPGLPLLLLIVAVIGVPFSPIHHKLYLQFTLIVTLLVIWNALYPLPILASSIMRKIGEVSYSMYLIHFAVLMPSMMLAGWLFPADDIRTMLTHLIATYIVSFLLSCVTFAAIERPAIRWAAARARRFTAPVRAPAISS